MKDIKFIQYGCGKMSKYTIKFAVESGMKLVGAFDINPNIIGTSVEGVVVEHKDNFEKILRKEKPDIVIVTTMSLMSDVEEVLTICARNGVNAITTCEEAFYPKVSNPKITNKLDQLAKAHNCTITGSGYQDAYWGNLISTIAGSTHNITKIKGSSSYNVEDYGIALAEVHGSGMTLEEFDRKIAANDKISDEERKKLIESGSYTPSYMWNVVPWLAEKLNLHLEGMMKQECVAQTYSEDIKSETLNMIIKKGDATGMSAVVTGKTKEGIIIEAECIGKVYAPGEFDKNEWTVYGKPDTTLVINKPDTVQLTCASVVNRIPDVINAEAGFVPTCRMGELKYTKNK